MEEAAAPGATSVRLRVTDFPPAIHPRELPICRWHRRNHRSASLCRSYVFGESTVRHGVVIRNTKAFGACEQPVDGESSLWKAEEKREEILIELQEKAHNLYGVK